MIHEYNNNTVPSVNRTMERNKTWGLLVLQETLEVKHSKKTRRRKEKETKRYLKM